MSWDSSAGESISRYRHYYYDRCNRNISRGLDSRLFDSCSSQSCTIKGISCSQNCPSSLTRALGISCVDFSRLRQQANTGCYEIRNWRTFYKDGQTYSYMIGFFISIPFKNDGRFVSTYHNHGQMPWFSRKLGLLDIFIDRAKRGLSFRSKVWNFDRVNMCLFV